jgi:hypothetical protein
MIPFKANIAAFLKIPLLGRISLGAGFIGNGLVILSCLLFFDAPHDSSIRTFEAGWALFIDFVAACTLVLGLPSALISFKSCSRRVSIAGLLLSLAPLPIALILMNIIAAVTHLQLGE